MKAKIISIFILLMTCGHIYATQRDTINWECKTLNTRQVTNFTSLCNLFMVMCVIFIQIKFGEGLIG